MKAQCLPFRQIPHTTRLFSDFLYDFPKVQSFHSRPPYLSAWVGEEARQVRYDSARRARVAAILERQNQVWGGSAKAAQNIARLRAGALAVVTGQQVGLFGGPVFSIYKALSAVKLATQATAAGVECVPVFWLATEDHDLAEINHTSLPRADFTPQLLQTPTQGVADAPIATIRLGAEIEPVVEEAARLLGDSEVSHLLRKCYRPGESLGSAFGRLFANLFADWGVILLDASDPELDAMVEPVYRAAIERAAKLDSALLARGKELEDRGYHQQVKITPSSTLLFTQQNGSRVPVHRRVNGNSVNGDFLIEKEKISQSELLRRIADAPQDFSPNVLLRPVVQDYLLPTLAYVGGAAEVAYFAQAAVAYEALLGRVTPIIPRFSATLVEQKPQALLERYKLSLPDLFHGPEVLREQLAERTLPGDLQQAFHNAESSLEKSLAGIREALARLDVTLVDAARRTGSKMSYQLNRLRSRAAQAELRHTEVLGRHAALLSHALYPNKTLQEREMAGIYFVARHGAELLHQIYDTIHTDCLDHQVITL